MVIVNTKKEWDVLQRKMRTQPFVYLQMLSDVNKHSKQNRISCFYVGMMTQSYIIPVNHNERFGRIESVETEETICVADIKQHYHNSMVIRDYTSTTFGTIDLNWCHYMKTNQPYDFDKHLTNAHHHNYRLHYEKENVNDVIPLVKHAEYLSNVANELMDYVEDVEYYNQDILEVLSKIEKNGLQTTKNMVYTEYNPYTSTGRPSNRFGGLNFAALNKKDGSRKQFISRHDNGLLVEFDFDAYHLRLIGDVVGYDFPQGSVHEHMAKLYGLSYDDAKALSFKYLYGGITDEVKDNPFFSKVDDYVKDLWNIYKNSDFVKSDIYNRKIFKNNLQDMNPNKLFNYMIQLMETENNIQILDKLIPEIENFSSKLVLYNYDSFLFDLDYKKDGMKFLNVVKQILECDGKYPTKVQMGSNYHNMKDVTEKFSDKTKRYTKRKD